jgi:hypothetical protein
MVLINIGVFLAVLVLGFFIGWSSGTVHALEEAKEIINIVFEKMGIGGMPDDGDRAYSECGVRNDKGNMEI